MRERVKPAIVVHNDIHTAASFEFLAQLIHSLCEGLAFNDFIPSCTHQFTLWTAFRILLQRLHQSILQLGKNHRLTRGLRKVDNQAWCMSSDCIRFSDPLYKIV